jgi:glucose-6-phosphate isomerase
MSRASDTLAGNLELSAVYPRADSYLAAVHQLVADQVASRLVAQDSTLWGPEASAEAAVRLAWTGLAESSRALVGEITALREELLAEGLNHVVLAGMGGSSLAPEVICATEGVELRTLDTTDAGEVAAALNDKLDRTVLVVSSKSGGTVETDSHRRAYEKAFNDKGIEAKTRIIVVTDPGSPLHRMAEEAGYRKIFLANPNVGGRYSALTAFGLVPSGLAGADISGLLDDAASASVALAADDDSNPGLRLGALLGLAEAAGADKLVFADFGSGIVGFGDWAEQLVAESTGKHGRGLLPVVVESPEAPGFQDARRDSVLVRVGRSTYSFAPPSGWGATVAGPLGSQILLWEYATAIAGRIIGINPFDQPNVEDAKIQARSLLDSPASSTTEIPALVDGAIEVYAIGFDIAGATTLADVLTAFLGTAPELGYVSLQAYLDRHGDSDTTNLRPAVAKRSGLQTTFGWGPRFLHSTGQYHKGGHPNGVFLQITGQLAADLPVPGRLYTFATLQAAQAAGDAAVLAAEGRPVLHLHLTDRHLGIGQLIEAL